MLQFATAQLVSDVKDKIIYSDFYSSSIFCSPSALSKSLLSMWNLLRCCHYVKSVVKCIYSKMYIVHQFVVFIIYTLQIVTDGNCYYNGERTNEMK